MSVTIELYCNIKQGGNEQYREHDQGERSDLADLQIKHGNIQGPVPGIKDTAHGKSEKKNTDHRKRTHADRDHDGQCNGRDHDDGAQSAQRRQKSKAINVRKITAMVQGLSPESSAPFLMRFSATRVFCINTDSMEPKISDHVCGVQPQHTLPLPRG